MSRPVAIVVTGSPASGKTTLAKVLSDRYRIPILAKDSFKEVLFDVLGTGDRQWSKMLGLAAYGLLMNAVEEQLRCGNHLIIDANFHQDAAEPIRDMASRHSVDLVQILCRCEMSILMDRYRQRHLSGIRHPGHVDEAVISDPGDDPLSASSRALEIGGRTVVIDTTDLGAVDYSAAFEALDAAFAASGT